MLRRSLLALGCMGLLAVPALANGQLPPNCCAKPGKYAGPNTTTKVAKGEQLKCSLTEKVVDTCCCIQREGMTYCTLAKKSVEKCCCRPVPADQNQSR